MEGVGDGKGEEEEGGGKRGEERGERREGEHAIGLQASYTPFPLSSFPNM